MRCPDSHPRGLISLSRRIKESTQGNRMAKVGSVIKDYDEKHLCRDRWGMVVDPELFEHRRRMRGDSNVCLAHGNQGTMLTVSPRRNLVRRLGSSAFSYSA